MSRRNERITTEILYLLRPQYGNIEWDKRDYDWILVNRFAMPRGWINKNPADPDFYNTSYTPLALEIPKAYPSTPPQNFYIDQNISCPQGWLSHYFQAGGGINRYSDKGWAYLSIHPLSWVETLRAEDGDNLLTILNMIYMGMQK